MSKFDEETTDKAVEIEVAPQMTPEQATAILKADSERKQIACGKELQIVLDKYGMAFRCDPVITQDGRIGVSGVQIVPKPS